MSLDLPPNDREFLESRITALLLGELSADEAAALRRRMAEDAELAKLHDRLKVTLELLREAAAPAAPKLSEARREKLLAHFKTVAPKEFAPQPRRRISRWLIAAGAAAVVVFLATIPTLHRTRSMFSLTSFINEDESGTLGGGRKREPSVYDSRSREPHMQGLASRQTPASAANSAGVEPATPPANGEGTNLYSLNTVGYINVPAQAGGQIVSAPLITNSATIVLPSEGGQESGNKALTDVAVTTQSGISSFGGGGGAGGGSANRMYRMPAPSPSAPTASTAPAPIAGAIFTPSFSLTTNQVPALGDVPRFGNLFRSEQKAGLTESNSEANGVPPATPSPQAEGKQSAPVFVGSPEPNNFKAAPVPQELPLASRTEGSANTLQLQFAAKEKDIEKLEDRSDAAGARRLRETEKKAEAVVNADNLRTFGFRTTNALALAVVPATPPPGAAPVAPTASQFEANLSKIVENANQPAAKADLGVPPPAAPAPVPQPEILTRENVFSTFSLNVSDVSFKLAAASLQNGVMPPQSSIRSEEFINALDYRDPEPAPGAPIAFACERAADPFAHHRDFLRFSIKTAAQGRQAGRPLNLVLLLDKSGSMERADRVAIVQKGLRVLAAQLQSNDTLSVVVFARTARLWKDGVPGDKAAEVVDGLNSLTPEGGTNLEEAMRLAYATALRHYLANGENRVVLVTDGAANLGSTDPEALKKRVAENRKQGIALDCFGVGWEGYNDTLLETLTRTGNGRYGFINTPEEADTEFAGQLAGALRVAAADVKVQVEFNPKRVTSYRQIGYAKHQLTKEQFRDNSVAAAQIGAAESGNAVYTVEVNQSGDGPLGTVRVRFRVPGTSDYQEHEWTVPYDGTAVALEHATPAMRMAAVAAVFSEWLAGSPYAAEAKPSQLLAYFQNVPAVYGADPRPAKLQTMILEAMRETGK